MKQQVSGVERMKRHIKIRKEIYQESKLLAVVIKTYNKKSCQTV